MEEFAINDVVEYVGPPPHKVDRTWYLKGSAPGKVVEIGCDDKYSESGNGVLIQKGYPYLVIEWPNGNTTKVDPEVMRRIR